MFQCLPLPWLWYDPKLHQGRDLQNSQFLPSYPSMQVHMYSPRPSWHLPWFWQGLVSHWSPSAVRGFGNQGWSRFIVGTTDTVWYGGYVCVIPLVPCNVSLGCITMCLWPGRGALPPLQRRRTRGQCGTCFWTGCWSEKEGTLFPKASGCGIRTRGWWSSSGKAPLLLVCHLLRGGVSNCCCEITSR